MEILGITATIFVLISFLMKDYRKHRLLNLIGADLFIVYGISIDSLSTWLLNSFLVIIHLYFLTIGKNK